MPRKFKMGDCRNALALLPPCIDQYISDDNLTRAIEAYINSLDIQALGFTNTSPKNSESGQPAYNPADLLKLYLWGFINRIRSSRRLELECYRNLEAIWLMSNLMPSYKTISDFRKNNSKALLSVNTDFILLCREMQLFGGELIGIDSAFIEGNASKASVYNEKQLNEQISGLKKRLQKYLQQLDDNDQLETEQDSKKNKEKLEKLTALLTEKKQLKEDLINSGDTQIGTTDIDARRLNKRTDKGPTTGYNLQMSVDDKHKLIVAHDVVNDRNDQHQLIPMIEKSKDALGVKTVTVVTDGGYFEQNAVKTCEDEGDELFIPVPNRCGKSSKDGQFCRDDFSYDADNNIFMCPNNKELTFKGKIIKREKEVNRYFSKASDCNDCPLKAQCLGEKSKTKQITRWQEEAVIDRLREKMESQGQEMMHKRSGLAEHPFGTIKLYLGWTHLLTRGFEKVRGEVAIIMTGYNFKRAINVLGMDKFVSHCENRA